jgi:hypothetical protein
VHAGLTLESRRVPWLQVFVTNGRSTSFDERSIDRDDLGLGRAELEEMPQYFARAARTLGVRRQWNKCTVSSNLRGRSREAVLQWLRAESER